MRDRWAQDELHVEMAVDLLRSDSDWRTKLHNDVSEFTLWTDEIARIRFAFFQLLDYLLGVIPTLGRVTFDLPHASQVFGRSQINFHIVELPHDSGVKAEQPLDNNELTRLNKPGPDKRTS